MTEDTPPILSVVGRKNSGKTTLLVALAAELKRRGLHVASLKHGHPHFEIDHPGRDSWRHVHEGEVEAVLMVSSEKVALVMRVDGEPDPRELVQRFYSGRGYDLVLAEGYKHGPFPKIEIFRRAVHESPLHDPGDTESAALYLGIATDEPSLTAACPVVKLQGDGAHVSTLANLAQAWLGEEAHREG